MRDSTRRVEEKKTARSTRRQCQGSRGGSGEVKAMRMMTTTKMMPRSRDWVDYQRRIVAGEGQAQSGLVDG